MTCRRWCCAWTSNRLVKSEDENIWRKKFTFFVISFVGKKLFTNVFFVLVLFIIILSVLLLLFFIIIYCTLITNTIRDILQPRGRGRGRGGAAGAAAGARAGSVDHVDDEDTSSLFAIVWNGRVVLPVSQFVSQSVSVCQ